MKNVINNELNAKEIDSIEKINGESLDIVKENVKKLKEIFPEVFCEDKIDFKRLEEVLGEYTDDSDERYRFEWHGKSEIIKKSQTPSKGTLRPCKEESKNWDTTENLYIEGENLEVLKLLQKSYQGKIKMIYIDPPYNTGNDFIYPDNYSDSLENYLKITGQKDEQGNRITTNPETSGSYHTKWLNMMYPRLRLARNLLAKDGVICISIDDKEVHNLRKMCDEIFGENNFQGNIHWRRRHNQPNDKNKMIGLVAEHILVYTKNFDEYRISGVGKVDCTGDFSNPDNDIRGDWASKPWKTGSDQTGSRYLITSPNGKVFDEEWMGDESTYNELVNDNRIYFPKGGDGLPRKKYFKFERQAEGQCANNWWPHEQFGHNQGANDNLTALFGVKNIFSNSKPCELLKGLMQISNVKENDIVMDFFAGSGTLAETVINNNFEESTNIKFILVQFPEDLDKSYAEADSKAKKSLKVAIDYLNKRGKKPLLTEIGKERIIKVGERLEKLNRKKALNIDMGFKVFKLYSSNIKPWNPDCNDLQMEFQDNMENFLPGRTEEDIIYEIMLKYGIDLTYPVDTVEFNGKKVFSIGFGALIICLDNNITLELVNEIVKYKNELNPKTCRVVFRDNGFKTDSVKTNAIEILRRNNIQEIMSI